MKGFINFVREQGVVGLAVGFILGGAVSKVVASLVADVINPLISLILGSAGNLAQSYWPIGSVKVMWGSFVAALVDFAVIAAVVYFGVRGLRLERLDRKNKH